VQLVGCLQNASLAIPLASYFINRLRGTIVEGMKPYHMYRLSPSTVEDLHLWFDFLKQANRGFSMNLLVNRMPTHITYSDACPAGMGGFSSSGTAWLYILPDEYSGLQGINNLLEYLGAVVTIWNNILAGHAPPLIVLLSNADNTSVVGWLQ
jgi:hypothetical protein